MKNTSLRGLRRIDKEDLAECRIPKGQRGGTDAMLPTALGEEISGQFKRSLRLYVAQGDGDVDKEVTDGLTGWMKRGQTDRQRSRKRDKRPAIDRDNEK